MEVGLIGSGKVGMNLAINIISNDIYIISYDLNQETMKKSRRQGIRTVESIQKMVNNLSERKIICIMVPSGEITKQIVRETARLLSTGDMIVDSGRNVITPVVATSLMMRYRSLEDDTFTGKVVASLQNSSVDTQ